MKNKKNHVLKSEKGFTLIELIVIIAILGIISLVAVPNVQKYLSHAKITTDVSNAKLIGESITYQITTNSKYAGCEFDNASFYSGIKKKGDLNPTEVEMIKQAVDMFKSIPSPKFDTSLKYFKVSVEDEEVIVRANDNGDKSRLVQVYPIPKAPYDIQ
jgi:prepilin-type N-terminal cleavage/methylation domain-containing protein